MLAQRPTLVKDSPDDFRLGAILNLPRARAHYHLLDGALTDHYHPGAALEP